MKALLLGLFLATPALAQFGATPVLMYDTAGNAYPSGNGVSPASPVNTTVLCYTMVAGVAQGCNFGTPGSATWGSITGTLSNQTDLQAALNAKGAGTVTSVSITTANGVSGTVANSNTTPAVTLALGAITPTSTNGVSASTMAFMDATSSVQAQLNAKALASVSNVITSATGGTGITSVTCATASCTNLRGTYTVIGGTATTGTIITLVWPTTTTAYVCSAAQNDTGVATAYLGLGHSVATATGMTISAGITVVGTTFSVDYICQP